MVFYIVGRHVIVWSFRFFHYRMIIIISIIIIIIIMDVVVITRSSYPSQVVYRITTNKTFLRHNCITFSRCYMCTETSYFRCGLISRTRYLDDMNTDESATSFYYVLMRSSSQLRYSNKGVPLYSTLEMIWLHVENGIILLYSMGKDQEDTRSFKTTV